MKILSYTIAIAGSLALASAALAQSTTPATPVGATPPGVTAPDVPVMPGLADLEKTTFACPKAALNAAAREVATHPSQGTYQFSYFNIVSGSHHAAYEVHFTSNVNAEPVLKFCVAVYCQQGFDPTSAGTVMDLEAKNAAGSAMTTGHMANPCKAPATRRKRR